MQGLLQNSRYRQGNGVLFVLLFLGFLALIILALFIWLLFSPARAQRMLSNARTAIGFPAPTESEEELLFKLFRRQSVVSNEGISLDAVQRISREESVPWELAWAILLTEPLLAKSGEENVKKELHDLRLRYEDYRGNWELALSAYRAKSAGKLKKVASETQQFVSAVLERSQAIQKK